jgi:hypothetical protein
MTRLYATAAALAALAFPAAAQNTASENMRLEFTAQAAQAKMSADMVDAQKIRAEVEHMAAGAKALTIQGGMMGPLVKGAPYSAEETSETTQALADGTRIHREIRTSVFRDGEGRLRRETPEAITIWDPVAGVSYLLDPKAMTAVKLSLSTGTEVNTFTSDGKQVHVLINRVSAANPDAQKAQAEARQMQVQHPVQVRTTGNAAEAAKEKNMFLMRIGEPGTLRHETGKSESLGRQSMEGLTVEGTRETFTIEAGSIGNDRPIQVLSERWYSPDLQLVVSSRHTDPRSGEETLRLTNVRRGEPGADRFQPSAAYKLIDHK